MNSAAESESLLPKSTMVLKWSNHKVSQESASRSLRLSFEAEAKDRPSRPSTQLLSTTMSTDQQQEKNNSSVDNRWPHWGTKPYVVMPHISPESKRIGESYQLRPTDVVCCPFRKLVQPGYKIVVNNYALGLVDMISKTSPSGIRGLNLLTILGKIWMMNR